MPDYSPFTCTGQELCGNAIIYDADGNYINTIYVSECVLNWYCPPNGLTWEWRETPEQLNPQPEPDPEPAPDPAPPAAPK